MKKFISLLTALCICVQMSAVPAKPIKRTIQQADGTTLTIMLRGDENYHFYTTLDGIPVRQNENGSYSYAVMNDGRLMASNRLAHNVEARTTEETAFVSSLKQDVNDHISRIWESRLEKRNIHRMERVKKNLSQEKQTPRRASGTSGTKKGLVIMVQFKGQTFKHSRTEYDNQFNKKGYNVDYHIGSVRDYFSDQSYGKLTIDFDVVGPYTLSREMSYYGKNEKDEDGEEMEGYDMHAGEMVAEAIRAADASVNFKDYDWDGDGKVDQVYVIFNGYAESSGAPSNTIWPHEWLLSSAEPDKYPKGIVADGVTLDTYACSNELADIEGSRMEGIGTPCHEFSHCLGLPDFYDTTYEGGFGMAYWSLMDSGCYGGPYINGVDYSGTIPVAYTAYERYYSGWLEPKVLNEGLDVTALKDITAEPDAYIIYNDANHNEFYIL